MKTAVVLTSLLAALAISVQAEVLPITVVSVTVTGADNADGSNVTVVAEIGINVAADGGQVMLGVVSTNGLIGFLFPPEVLTFEPFHDAGDPPEVVHGYCSWTNTSWNPYFAGDFVVQVVATDLTTGYSHTNAIITNVVRAIGGTMNSLQVPVDTNAAYDANGVFTNINTSRVFLFNNGAIAGPLGDSIPSTLVNVGVVYTNGMTDEQSIMAFMDTGAYRPSGTPFRFNMNLHARPTSMIGFGEIMRFVWTPDVATNPAGSGKLEADVVSCSPWRNGYATNFQAQIGCAPMFMTDTSVVAVMEGMIMSTSAHYEDVVPDISVDGRIGLTVNGNSNTASYLKAFIPDAMLDRIGVPVDRATNMLTGYVTHYNARTNSEGTIVETPVFTRIAGTNIVYAYSSTNGDSGYEVNFDFIFHSPVAAQIGRSSVEGDFDGDGKGDPYVVDARGNWYIFFSGGGYQSSGAIPFGQALWQSVAGDFDGDSKADPAMMDASGNWYIWFSGNGWQPSGAIPFGQAGTAVAGDFDGDLKADPAVVDASGNWYIWFSGNGWQPSGAIPFGMTGTAVAGDFDGDGKADPAIVDALGNWYVWFSGNGWQRSGAIALGFAGWKPVVGDFDGDGIADPAMVANNYWICCFSSGGFVPQGPILLSP